MQPRVRCSLPLAHCATPRACRVPHAQALHTYIEVSDIEKAKVLGLKGMDYLDKVADGNNPPTKTEDRDAVAFTGPVDRCVGRRAAVGG